MNYHSSGSFQSSSDPAWVRSLVAGSILAFVLVSGTPVIRQMLRRRPKPNVVPRFNDGMLESLRTSILQLNREEIEQLLGPPHALGTGEGTTWYYPVDDAEQVAMAIQFEDDRVWVVEFF